ncbi:hypothetical protein NXY23_18900 [Bacteroides thetaiotaomicron]|nr:hypothetical protein [Bacteroides thetaiotaomicron]UVS52524.1 hypothetical protein NXY23_18900 [Bacteroides thetaiotaomicron]
MNILFIGGAGFIGSSLVKRFISDEKHSVFILGTGVCQYIETERL